MFEDFFKKSYTIFYQNHHTLKKGEIDISCTININIYIGI
jgi:hypothetical protein